VLTEQADLNDRTVSWFARKAFRVGMAPHMPTTTAGNEATWTQ